MRTRFVLSSLTCLIVLAPVSLPGQEITSPYRYVETNQSVGAFAGYLWTHRGEEGLEIGPHSAPIAGIRYNVRFGGPATGEGSVSFAPSRRDIFERVFVDDAFVTRPTGESVSVSLLLVEGGVRLHLPGPRTWHGLAPYLLATGGLVTDLNRSRDIEDARDLPMEQRFRMGPTLAVGMAAGTDWFPGERVSLRLEARNQIWRLTTPRGIAPLLESETHWRNNFGLSVGGAIHF